MADIPLERVPGWSQDQIARLKTSWITTAEQVVALSNTTDGTRSLAEHLGVSEGEARRLVGLARDALPPSTRAEMDRKVDTYDYGLGARPPRPEREED